MTGIGFRRIALAQGFLDAAMEPGYPAAIPQRYGPRPDQDAATMAHGIHPAADRQCTNIDGTDAAPSAR